MTLLAYLLKVIVVSAILFGYYRIFLRNKRFHHYNRFFLLSALLLSVVLPFIRIPLLYQPENPVNDAVYRTVSVINADYGEDISAETVAPMNEPVFTLMNCIYLLYAIGVLFLLMLVFKSLLYIRMLRKRYPAENITSLRFYNTREPGTPFSFFRSVFWNDQLSFNSREGQQIFRHELFHVQHQHSADRLLSEVLTAIFWFNPFFHLIKKELKAIHEFLADQFACSGSDRYAYATLLVQQALESGKHAVTNHFFQNHIKRRIAMITQFQQSKYGYWSRLMVLPVSLLLFCFITLYAKKPAPGPGKKPGSVVPQQPVTVNAASVTDQSTDTIPGRKEKERMLEKMQQAQLEDLKRKLQEKEQNLKNERRVELEALKKQMMEQELLLKEREQNGKEHMDEALQLKKELLNRQIQLNNEVKLQQEKMKELIKEHEVRAKENPANKKQSEVNLEVLNQKMKEIQLHLQNQQRAEEQMMQKKILEIEMRSKQQQEDFKNRQENLRTLKQQLIERESILKKLQLQEVEKFKEELKRIERERKEKEDELRRQREREEKDEQKENEGQESGFNMPARSVQDEDELLKKVIRQYHRNIRFPEPAIQHGAQGSIYFSVVVDKNGSFTDFKTYNKPPEAKQVTDLVIVTHKTPYIVAEKDLTDNEKEEILKKELERTTVKNNANPVPHPESRRYYFRAVFKMNGLKENSTFLSKNAADWQIKPVNQGASLVQDTIPAKPAAKARAKATAKAAAKAEPYDKDSRKPRTPAKLSKEPTGPDNRKAHQLNEPRRAKEANPEKKKLFTRKPAKLFEKKPAKLFADKPARVKEARKTSEKSRKIRAKSAKENGSGQIPDEGNEENYSEISVTGDK